MSTGKNDALQNHLKKTLRERESSKSADETTLNLFELVQRDTLGYQLVCAISRRRHGRAFNDVAKIAEAGRAHMGAIRAVQAILDEADGGAPSIVIVEKYWRVYPLQIGILNGGNVLALMNYIERTCNFVSPPFRKQLHGRERKIHCLRENCRMRLAEPYGHNPPETTEEEMDMSEHALRKEELCLIRMKLLVLKDIAGFVQTRYGGLPHLKKVSLMGALFILMTSTIETLDAEFVDIYPIPVDPQTPESIS